MDDITPMRRLPPLNALRAFEAAGRHLNLGAAANELFVTHGAVSKQVKSLENLLGVELTKRTRTGMVLFLHAILIDADVELAMSLGHTVVVQDGAPEILSGLDQQLTVCV